ncbi:efflux RND transporter periplasmic adaptor subunit [Cognatishimia activa]|uniref:Toluene efflux pump periplasmic linker protein TtgD n=1 Tax=Cognatishimia activa TaxID=1715691 RepID=A0A0P1IMM0_9RHOB|nr:efflux RND transporter periplasmic adaptor subunit [Cognatishimia activa]CUI33304.1 Toluene efflux pump periplasmic linker protein TtgD precursor [Cognatishimia activa]CUK24785.1 Toluene efflux pump periplasmic linker protein TtgD precursor [Cognatishimia activa]
MYRPLLAAAFAVLATPQLALAQEEQSLVKLVTVNAGADQVTRVFFGQVAAKETVDLAFQVAGQIVQLPIVEGAVVPEGAVIAQLDLEPFELALDQAVVQKDQADRTVERLTKLQGNTVSQVTVDDAQTQAQLADISQRNAQRSLNNATLHAPFDALVASRNVAKFSTINAGTPVARLHDMSDLRIEIDVPEVLFQRAGRDPDVTLSAKFPASDTVFPLEVREFNAETSAVGQTFRITLGMTPPDDLVVLPGSSVTVSATLSNNDQRILIPASAIKNANDGTPMALVFEPAGADEGTLRAVDIEIVPDVNGNVQVVSGLSDGQEIVASGASRLTDGASARRFTGFAN